MKQLGGPNCVHIVGDIVGSKSWNYKQLFLYRASFLQVLSSFRVFRSAFQMGSTCLQVRTTDLTQGQ